MVCYVSYLLRGFVVRNDSNDAGGGIVAVELDEQIFLVPPHELRSGGKQAEADQRLDRRLLFYREMSCVRVCVCALNATACM